MGLQEGVGLQGGSEGRFQEGEELGHPPAHHHPGGVVGHGQVGEEPAQGLPQLAEGEEGRLLPGPGPGEKALQRGGGAPRAR